MLNYDTYSIDQATALQNELRHKVLLETHAPEVRTIAGGDISHNPATGRLYAGIVVLTYPELVPISYSLTVSETKFPYVPHYLAFREIPALLQAWQQLPEKPDVLVLDGQGITHPRRLGIAAHFGVLTNHPTIGCAKNMLFGTYKPLGHARLATSPIIDGEEILGYVLRTKEHVKPVYISPGHKVSLKDSISIMKMCVGKYRIPEPTRLAHDKVNLFRIGQLQQGVIHV